MKAFHIVSIALLFLALHCYASVPTQNNFAPQLSFSNGLTGRFLHISDMHYDHKYLVGSVSNCDGEMCCRNESVPIKGQDPIPAGIYGAAKCDAPAILLEETLAYAASQGPYDFIIMTGDDAPHLLLGQTPTENLYDINGTSAFLRQYFPNTPIFPSLGNHDSFPTSSFVMPEYQWLLNDVASYWGALDILPADTLNFFKYGGYYSLEAFPGLLIICLNTDYYDTWNPLVDLNKVQDQGQLVWLNNTLITAQGNNQKVMIIGHISPGSKTSGPYPNAIPSFNNAILNITIAFQDIIVAQLYGHTHRDEFRLITDPSTSQAVGVAFLQASVTPYVEENPSIRIYSYDVDNTLNLMNYEVHSTNLTEANIIGTTQWSVLYDALSSYQLADMSPQSWEKLAFNMIANEDTFNLYLQHYDAAWTMDPVCAGLCRRIQLCAVQHIVYGDFLTCVGLSPLDVATMLTEDTTIVRAC